jgi:hypothetical protein
MTPYNLTIARRGYPGEYVTILFGKDREEVIAFTKKAYKKVLVKVISARKVPKHGNPGR